MTDPIPKEELEAARRRLKRQVASMMIGAMAETDAGFELLGERLGTAPASLRRWIYRMIEGKGEDLNAISDLALAMECRVEFSLMRFATLPEIGPEGGAINAG